MLIIQGLRASRVNLLQNDFAAGLPSPMAFLGLMASMAPRLGVDRWSIGVLPIIHALQISEGRTRGQIAKEGSGIKVLDIPADLLGTVRFSLIVDLDESFSDAILDEVVKARLAGGVIFEDGAATARSVSAGRDLARSAPGRIIAPAGGFPVARTARDVAGYVDALFPFPDSDEGRTGWNVPVAVGYRLMGRPDEEEPRAGVRDPSVPHVFAEPLGGIGQLISHKGAAAASLDKGGLSALCWRYVKDAPYVLAHPVYRQTLS